MYPQNKARLSREVRRISSQIDTAEINRDPDDFINARRSLVNLVPFVEKICDEDFAQALAEMVTFPIDFAKTRMQLHVGKRGA